MTKTPREHRAELVIVDQPGAPGDVRWMATWGDYDLDCAFGVGETAADAAIDLIETHGVPND